MEDPMAIVMPDPEPATLVTVETGSTPLADAIREQNFPGLTVHTATTLDGIMEVLADGETCDILIVDGTNEVHLKTLLELLGSRRTDWGDFMSQYNLVAAICNEQTNPDTRQALFDAGVNAYERTVLPPLFRRIASFITDEPQYLVLDPNEDEIIRDAVGVQGCGDGLGQYGEFFATLEDLAGYAAVYGGNVIVINCADRDDDELQQKYDMIRDGEIEGLEPIIPIIFVDKDGLGSEWLDHSNPKNIIVPLDVTEIQDALAEVDLPHR